jgi:hypothetical protein
MAQDLNYIVVEAATIKELEKKVNDRMAFGYTANTPIVVTQNNQGSTFYQTMIKAK